jgi:formamidopyrimidine-DNA glycosylase
MPEGDTIHRTAQTLHAALSGRTVTAFEAAPDTVTRRARSEAVVGQRVAGVEAQGKHLQGTSSPSASRRCWPSC